MSELPAHRRRHCAAPVAVFILTMLCAAVLSCLQTPEFAVRARIMVQADGGGLGHELAILRSEVLAEQVLAAVGGERLFPDEAEAGRLRRFQKQLKARPDGTRAIEIFFRHPQAGTAVQALEELIRLFRLQLEKIQRQQTEQLQEQLRLAWQQMRQAESHLLMRGQQSQPSSAQDVERLRQELKAEEEKLQTQAAALADLERHYAAGLDDDRVELLRLRLYERELLRKYEEQEPLTAEVRQQIGIVREQLRQSGVADVDGLERLAEQIMQAKADWRSQQEAEAAARKRLAQLEKKQQLIAGQEEAFQVMQAELAASRQQHASLLAQLQASRRREGAAQAVAVLEPPLPPLKPTKPHMLRNLLVGAALGLAFSLLFQKIFQRSYRPRPAQGE